MIIADILERNALHFGERVGLVFQERRYTHRQYLERVYRLANALIGRGLKHQDRIGLLARNGSDYLEVFGAAEVAGFIVVNMNHRLAQDELIDIARDSAPAILIYAAEFAEVAQAILSEIPGIGSSVRIGATGELADEYEVLLFASEPSRPAMRAIASDIVYLIYTSGTTGRPKGVMLDHAAMLDGVATLCRECGVLSSDTTIITMPLFHSGALIVRLTFALAGATIILHEGFELKEFLQSVHRERATATNLAPVMLRQILDESDQEHFDFSTLRIVIYSSAPMPASLLSRAVRRFGPIFAQVYGMTECISGTYLPGYDHNPDGSEEDIRRLSSAGRPSVGTELRIVRQDGQLCASGEAGEILLRNKATMRGYWNNHTSSVETMRDGWMHTQDIGFVDQNGYLFVVDRKRDMVISGGENIYTWEVEEAMRSHEATQEVAVIGVPDDVWGESVMAFIILRANEVVSEAEMIAYCKSKIASYKKPRFIKFVDSLPRLFNGKVDKKQLRAPYWKGRTRNVA